MKRQVIFLFVAVALLVLVFTANSALAQGPKGGQPKVVTDATSAKFTYQGQLKQGTSAFTGTCAFQFSLWDDAGTGSPPTGGTQIGGTQTVPGVSVANGLFTVQLNGGSEFGATAFDGNARYLQIGVKCGSESVSTVLAPRQELTAAPYAHSLRPGAVVQNVATTGTTPVITGESLSTSMDAIGVKGQIGSTSPGAWSAGVRGINNGTSWAGVGVYGSQAGSGYGVYGTTPGGYGVIGSTTSGTGVSGNASASGKGISASNNSSSGIALEIAQGAIKVTGAGLDTSTAVFIHTAVPPANTCNYGGVNNATWFTTSQTDNDSTAILFVTFKGGGANVNSPLGVVYDDGTILCHPTAWLIYRLDGAAMPLNARFNIMVIKP